MPAYDRPMIINTPRRADPRVGAVIVFTPGTNAKRAQEFIDRLVQRGICERTTAHDFDANGGSGPVWYIP